MSYTLLDLTHTSSRPMTELAPAVTESFAMITDAIDHNGTCLVEIVPIKAHLIEGVKLRSPS